MKTYCFITFEDSYFKNTNSVLTIAIIELLAWPWSHVVLSNRHSAAYLIHFLLPGDCIHGNCLSDGCIILRHSHQILHYVNICHRGPCTEDFHLLLPFLTKMMTHIWERTLSTSPNATWLIHEPRSIYPLDLIAWL